MFEHNISCQIMCSTEELISFDAYVPFLPYENQSNQYLCKNNNNKHCYAVKNIIRKSYQHNKI